MAAAGEAVAIVAADRTTTAGAVATSPVGAATIVEGATWLDSALLLLL